MAKGAALPVQGPLQEGQEEALQGWLRGSGRFSPERTVSLAWQQVHV